MGEGEKNIDWRAEAEVYRRKCEQLQAELAAAHTKITILESAMRSAARTLLGYVTLNK
jgi:hypothetical protein